MDLLIIALIGAFAAFAGSFMSGGLSLISMPLLLLTGMPPLAAFGALKVGTLGFDIGGLIRYIQEKKVDWSLFVPLTIASVAGGYIGGTLLLSLDEELITRLVGFIMLCFIPIVLFYKNLGIVETKVSRKRRWFGHLMSFVAYIYLGSLALGFGIFHSIKQMYFYGLTVIKAKASAKLPTVIGSLGVTTLFWFNGIIVWSEAFSLLGGMFVGSYIGVKYSVMLGDLKLKYILLATMFGFGVYFLFF